MAKDAGAQRIEDVVGRNIKMALQGKTLTLTIDLGHSLGKSKTGKSTLVASTGGNVSIPGSGGIKLGINCYKPE